ncbi:MAG: hypothetical protein Q4D02_02835 [Clostridia bacterium]|nr:hypothetical protein [Clostridia bacterium]
MARFEELVKKATGGVQRGLDSINAKADDLANTVALKEQMQVAEAEIQEIYLEAGKKALELGSGFFAEQAERVKELEAFKEDCECQLLAKQGLKKCPACKNAIPAEDRYCPECGVKIEKE